MPTSPINVLTHTCLTTAVIVLLSACAGNGTAKTPYVPIETYFYNHETVLDTMQLNINQRTATCQQSNRPVAVNDIGKMRTGGRACGQVIMPTHTQAPTKITLSWRVQPYPSWRLPTLANTNKTAPDQARILLNYTEAQTAVLALPPYEKICRLSVHFLACNQIYIDTGCQKTRSYESLLVDMGRFKQSQALCQARPKVESWQDYRQHKALMDKIKAERATLSQQFLAPTTVKPR